MFLFFPKMDIFPMFSQFFLSDALLRQRRKKALLRVNNRGGGWKMCILGLCPACACVLRVLNPHVARTSAVNLRRYGDTLQKITIHDLIQISLLCTARSTQR